MKKQEKTTRYVEESIIGTICIAPEAFQMAAKYLMFSPSNDSTVHIKVFEHFHFMWKWFCKMSDEMRTWDVQVIAAEFGDISSLITAAEPETFTSAVQYLREEYIRKVDTETYLNAMSAIKTESPQDVRDFVAARTAESIYIDQEKSRADRMYESWQDIEVGEIGVPTCWDDFNELTGGVQRGQTGILTGSTGTGKTQDALRMLLDLAKSGKPCLFFSVELTEKQVWQRVYSIESGISMKELSNRTIDPATGKYKLSLSPEKHKQLSEALSRVSKAPFYVADAKEVTNKATMLRQKIRQYIRNYDLFAYCIDYVQLCETGLDKVDNSGNETKVLSKFAKDMSNFNKSANVLGLWLSQLNRGIMSRADRRPRNSDIMATSSLENAADWILHKFRPGAYEDWEVARYDGAKPISKYTYNGNEYNPYDCEYILSKNRAFGGKTGSWWEWQEQVQPVSNQFPVKQEAQKHYDTAMPAQAGRDLDRVIPF